MRKIMDESRWFLCALIGALTTDRFYKMLIVGAALGALITITELVNEKEE